MSRDPNSPIFSTLAADPDLGELVQLFAAEVPNRAATMQSAAARGDREGLRQIAHQLAGAAGSYGFHEITSRAAAVEGALGEQRSELEIVWLVNELVDACRRVRGGSPASPSLQGNMHEFSHPDY